MIIFDIFYYMVFCFAVKTLRQHKGDAKASALCHFAVWFSFFVNSIIALVGVIKDNPVSSLVLNKSNGINNVFVTYIIVVVILFVIFGVRYYKVMDVEDIEKKIKELPKHKLLLMRASVYIFQIAVPVCGYMFSRLYWYGHI